MFRLVWWLSDEDAYMARIPWWAGYVQQVELRTQMAVVPFNLILLAWNEAGAWLRWKLARAAYRRRHNHRAIRSAFERGRRAGFNQGKADAAMRMGRFADEYISGLRR